MAATTTDVLTSFPRVALAQLPTPLEFLPRLSEYLRGPRIFIKRDDQTGLALGGNKVRKLEFLAAEALARGCDTLLTIGGVQSNHARQTAAAAAKLGLRCELVLPRIVPRSSDEYEESGNVLLDHLLGAHVRMLPTEQYSDATLAQVADELRGKGHTPYLIPTGGSSPLGALGYVAALFELLVQVQEQGISLGAVIVPTGSGGTTAGILAGLRAAGQQARVIGAAVSATANQKQSLVQTLTTQVLELLELRTTEPEEFMVTDRAVGAGYGIPTDETIDAVRRTAQLEGILLDPVYTGKAMAALFDLVRRDYFTSHDEVVFWHTGGAPALFAYRDTFETQPSANV